MMSGGNETSPAMRAEELDFHLPEELIAQSPAAERADSRLLHYRKSDGAIAHYRFGDLPRLLRRGDLLVFNDTRVLPARFVLRKETGGRIEGLFLHETRPGRWQVLLKGLEKHRGRLHFEGEETLSVVTVGEGSGGVHEIELSSEEPAAAVLGRVGRMPLPPYIRREKTGDGRDEMDRERYQTVYARADGSVAAPTAGLHFTPLVLAELEAMEIQRAFVTLHVGLGTFKPLTAATVAEHVMHSEAYAIGEAAAEALNAARAGGRRIVAVGTTSARVLESHPADEPWAAGEGRTAIFIHPPYRWRWVGGLVTNFHLPRSTLIALVAAFVGLGEQRRVYAAAIAQRYRFFSYGDAMLMEG
jgi:S-adenosylmethionine:tRNA ribosyltransferase-isomerase